MTQILGQHYEFQVDAGGEGDDGGADGGGDDADEDAANSGEDEVGLGRIVALYCRSCTLYHIHEHIRCLYF